MYFHAGFCIAVGLAVSIEYLALRSDRGAVAGYALILLMSCVAAAFLLVLKWTIRIDVTETGVRARHITTGTRFLRWADVSKVSYRPNRGLRFTSMDETTLTVPEGLEGVDGLMIYMHDMLEPQVYGDALSRYRG